LGSALHGAGGPTMLMAVLYGIISVAFSVWFTAIIRAGWTGSGPLRARAGQASYTTYFLHPLPLTAIMVLFGPLALAPELKFLIVAVVAVPACFMVGYAGNRLLGISRALLTASGPAAQADRRATVRQIPQSGASVTAPARAR
jgi:glucans biosynthesis protein C